MIDLTTLFKDTGFNQNYSAKPDTYGTEYAPGHGSHIHHGKTLRTAQREIQANRPPSKPGGEK
jgi:hypothetical protein